VRSLSRGGLPNQQKLSIFNRQNQTIFAPALALLEAICKKRGISYEEVVREAIDLFLERGPEDEDNEGEEWKD
jgi:hypothetical protein